MCELVTLTQKQVSLFRWKFTKILSLGRELVRKPELLVANQPTWGVDVGAATMIRQALIDLANSGFRGISD